MGIIAKFKQMFSRDIKPDPAKIVGLVFPYTLKHSSIKIDSTVVVPEGFSFVIGHTGKALDYFNQGEYILAPATLPNCCKKLKIHKQDKHGNFKKSFKADVYFVKLGEHSYSFKTMNKAELGGRASGIFSVGLSANVKIKVLDAKRFVEALLEEYDYLKQNEAEKLLKIWTDDLVTKILYKYNFALSEFISSNPIVETNIKAELGQKFSKIGLILEDLTEIRYILPKKYQKEYESNLAKLQKEKESLEQDGQEYDEFEQNQSQDIQDIQPDQIQLVDQTYMQQTQEYNKQPNVSGNIEEYVPYGSIVIESASELEKQKTYPIEQEVVSEPEPKTENSEIEQQNTYVMEQENEFVSKQPAEEKTEFVDLNLDNLYNTNKDGIKCGYCGYLNDKQNTVCEVCERSLKGE